MPEAAQRKGSRHKDRKMVAISPRTYNLVAALARKNGRPVSWQFRIIIEQALIAEGLLRQEDATYLSPDHTSDN